jgi:hypothetical protein
MRELILVLTGVVALPSLHAQQAAPPADRPFHTDSAAIACLDRAIQPRITEARRTFPNIRERFANGLPANHQFSVTTRLRDSTGRFEQAFVGVDSIRRDTIVGRVASHIAFVHGYRWGQRYLVPLVEVMDWTIVRPDGTEEGNFVGKYLDSLQDQLQRGGIPKPC